VGSAAVEPDAFSCSYVSSFMPYVPTRPVLDRQPSELILAGRLPCVPVPGGRGRRVGPPRGEREAVEVDLEDCSSWRAGTSGGGSDRGKEDAPESQMWRTRPVVTRPTLKAADSPVDVMSVWIIHQTSSGNRDRGGVAKRYGPQGNSEPATFARSVTVT
jgi:hypothetical protein